MKKFIKKIIKYLEKTLAIYVTFLGTTLLIDIFFMKNEFNIVTIFNIFILSLIALSWSLKQFKI